jgi:hypothetical protein
MSVLLVILIIIALFAAPIWPYSATWHPAPLGTVVVLILILILLGYV